MMLKLPEIGAPQSNCDCDVTDKQQSVMHYVCTMLNRTNQMMEYENLPETIPARYLELILQIHGHADFVNNNGEWYVFAGNLGGAPDPYYRPTFSVIANPALSLTGTFEIMNHLKPASKQHYDGECVVMRNDSQMLGLIPLFSRYASQLTENDISLRCAQINMRTRSLISAATDKELKAAQKYLDEIEKGHIISVGEKAFLDGVKVQQHGVQAPNTIIQLIELQQYLKAAWFNDMGLNANFNMKREYMSTEELQANTDVLLPLIDDMLQCRQEALDFLNEKYGLNITVKKNSAWERKQVELDTAQDKSESEVVSLLADAAESDGENLEVAQEISSEQQQRVSEENDNIVDYNQEDADSGGKGQLHESVIEVVSEVIERAMAESAENSEIDATEEAEEKELEE